MPLDPDLTEFTTTQQVLASYSYTDIRSGTGFQTYYAAVTIDSTGQDEILTARTIYSDEKKTTFTIPIDGAGAVFAKQKDYNFDLSTFNLPLDIKGTADINVSWTLETGGGGEGYFIFKFRKWDGTTETEIGSVQTETITIGDAIEKTSLVSVVLPLTNFQSGETLRLTAEIWTRNLHNTITTDFTFCHDPKDRTVSSFDTSQLIVNVPFKLDL